MTFHPPGTSDWARHSYPTQWAQAGDPLGCTRTLRGGHFCWMGHHGVGTCSGSCHLALAIEEPSKNGATEEAKPRDVKKNIGSSWV